jgi:hypothetical protein
MSRKEDLCQRRRGKTFEKVDRVAVVEKLLKFDPILSETPRLSIAMNFLPFRVERTETFNNMSKRAKEN